jgi:hypothetical protein
MSDSTLFKPIFVPDSSTVPAVDGQLIISNKKLEVDIAGARKDVLAPALEDATSGLYSALAAEEGSRIWDDDLIRDRLDSIESELPDKANIYMRQAQGITVGNNIQGMHVKVSADTTYSGTWSFETADGQSFVRNEDGFSYFDAEANETLIFSNNEVLVEDFVIEQPFLISQINGSYSNPEYFWRYFDIKDIDQRIGLVSALHTEDKSSVVNGINSLKTYVDAIVESAEVSDSPFESYAAFLLGSGSGIQQGKYAYVTFTNTDAYPSGGKWDMITIGDTWRLDCGVAVWSPTTNMTAATTATLADQSATNELKSAGNDTVTTWLQSFRNNLKRLFGIVKTDGDGKSVLLNNGTYTTTDSLTKVDTVNGIVPDSEKNVQTDYVYATETEFEAAKANIPIGATVIKLYEYPESYAGFMAVPDYSKRETLTGMVDVGNTWTANRDGFVWVTIGNQVIDNARFNINGKDILNVVGTNDYQSVQMMSPICKNDVLSITGRAAHLEHDGFYTRYAAYFYPVKHIVTPNAASVIGKLTPAVAKFIGQPDYSRIESTNRFTTNVWENRNGVPVFTTNNWVADRDGYFLVRFSLVQAELAKWSSGSISVNGKTIDITGVSSIYPSDSVAQSIQRVVLISKNDTIKFEYATGIAGTNVSCQGLFIPPLTPPSLFVEGADLQSSTATGKVKIDPETKTMSVSGEIDTTGTYSINRPDLWAANVELDFGSGLYGQRLTGTYSYTMAAVEGVVVGRDLGMTKLISYGGEIRYNASQGFPISYFYGNSGTSPNHYYRVFRDTTRFYAYVYTLSATITNAPYDIWVTYTK